MKYLSCALLISTTLVGCAVQTYPQKRPMQAAYKPLLSAPLPVNVPKDQKGIAVNYFAQDSSAAGTQFGLVGALVTASIDAAMNATPASIAEKNAEKIGEKIKPSELLATTLASMNSNKSKLPDDIKLQLDQLKNTQNTLLPKKQALQPLNGWQMTARFLSRK